MCESAVIVVNVFPGKSASKIEQSPQPTGAEDKY